jgi:hypothetical protein
MPDLRAHKRQVQSNLKFNSALNQFGQDFFDWRITTLFYTIVHYADALCAKNGYETVVDHKDRENKLYSLIPRNFFTLYRGLKNASIKSRYEVHCLGPHAAPYWNQVYQNYYSPLKSFFEKQLP